VGVGEIHRKNVLGEDTMYIHSDLSEVNLLEYRLLPHQMMVGLTIIERVLQNFHNWSVFTFVNAM